MTRPEPIVRDGWGSVLKSKNVSLGADPGRFTLFHDYYFCTTILLSIRYYGTFHDVFSGKGPGRNQRLN
jgi:hypothetical protein